MSGLELITSQILEESKQKANEILQKAKDQTKEQLQKAETEMKELAAGKRAELEKELDMRSQMAESDKRRLERQSHLKVKSAAIDEALKEAKQRIKALPEEEYRKLMVKLFLQYAESGDCEIVTSEQEKNRLGESFLAACCEGMKKGKAVFSKDLIQTDAGFVIRYGRVEENCTLDGIFASREQELRDTAAACLDA